MKLEQCTLAITLAKMAYSESAEIKTESGETIYVFSVAGFERFSDKVLIHLAAMPRVCQSDLNPPLQQPGLHPNSHYISQIAQLESKLFESSEALVNIGRECALYKAHSESLAKACNIFEAENKRLFNQVALIAGDRDASNRRIVEVMAERDNLQRKVESLNTTITAVHVLITN